MLRLAFVLCVKKGFSKLNNRQTEQRALANCLNISLLTADIDVSMNDLYQFIKDVIAEGTFNICWQICDILKPV